MDENSRQHEEMERRWNREWGPELSPWKRRLSGILVIVVFVGLLVVAFITAEG